MIRCFSFIVLLMAAGCSLFDEPVVEVVEDQIGSTWALEHRLV